MDMKYGALAGWGIVIYAVIYLTWNGLAVYGLTSGIWPRLFELAVLVVATTIAGRSLKFTRWTDILPYSIAWTLVAMALDALLTFPFAGAGMYQDWNIWIGYALLVLLPLASPLTRLFYNDARETI